MTDAEFLAVEDFKIDLTDFRERFDKAGRWRQLLVEPRARMVEPNARVQGSMAHR